MTGGPTRPQPHPLGYLVFYTVAMLFIALVLLAILVIGLSM